MLQQTRNEVHLIYQIHTRHCIVYVLNIKKQFNTSPEVQ